MNRLFVLGLLVLAVGPPAGARDLFTADIAIGGGTPAQVGTNRARDLPDLFDTSTLVGIEPGYDASQAVSANLDVRGLGASMNFDALSSELRFLVPGANIDVTFDAASRDEAVREFEDWLEGEFGSSAAPSSASTRLMQALVAHSPVDPVAGNPGSLESRMFDADYRMGTGGAIAAFGDRGMLPASASLKVGGGFYRAGDFDQYALDLPLRFHFGLGESFALVLDLPVAFTNTQGAWAGIGSTGLALQVKPFSWWMLTPAARLGGAGSVDLGGLAGMYSGSLTSHVRVPLGPIALGVTNMGGIARTIDGIEVYDYSLSYELENWNLRNGGYVEIALGSDTLGTGWAVRLEASDIRFFGDELWLDSYQEIGASVAAGLPIGGLQVGVAYLTGRDYDGVTGRLGLRF